MGLLTGFWRYLVDTWDSFILLFPPWAIWLLAILAFIGYAFGIFSKVIDMAYRFYYNRNTPPIGPSMLTIDSTSVVSAFDQMLTTGSCPFQLLKDWSNLIEM